MTKYFCDMCGKEAKEPSNGEHTKTFGRGLMAVRIGDVKFPHVCRRCRETLVDMIEKRGINKGVIVENAFCKKEN